MAAFLVCQDGYQFLSAKNAMKILTVKGGVLRNGGRISLQDPAGPLCGRPRCMAGDACLHLATPLATSRGLETAASVLASSARPPLLPSVHDLLLLVAALCFPLSTSLALDGFGHAHRPRAALPSRAGRSMAAFVCGGGALALRTAGHRRAAAAVSRHRDVGLGSAPPLPMVAPPRRSATLRMQSGGGGSSAGGGGRDDADADVNADADEDVEVNAVSGDDMFTDADDDDDSTIARGGSSDSEYDTDELGSYPTSLSGRSDSGSRDSEFIVDDKPGPSVSSALAKLSRLAGGSGAAGAPTEEESNELVKFVQSVPPPELMRRFKESAPAEVQSAMRQTLTSMLGSLPANAFQTSVRTATANLVQLMSSLLLSGYLIRNAQYRYGLVQSLSPSKQLPGAAGEGADVPAVPRIEGGVAVFAHADGTTSEMPVAEYVAELRSEVALLRGELTRTSAGSNPLVAFMASMEPANLSALTANAGEEVVEAMRKIVEAVVEREGLPAKGDAIVESGVVELGSLLFWLLVTGYYLREGEVRLQLKRSLGGGDERGLLEEERP